MYKIRFSPKIDVGVYASVNYGEADSCPIDQSPCEDFNINPDTGRPMSDISRLLRAQTKYEQTEMLKRMEERPIGEVMTKEQLVHSLKYAQPRLAQLPSELADFTENLYARMASDRQSILDGQKDVIEKELEEFNYADAKAYVAKRKIDAKRAKLEEELTKS